MVQVIFLFFLALRYKWDTAYFSALTIICICLRFCQHEDGQGSREMVIPTESRRVTTRLCCV